MVDDGGGHTVAGRGVPSSSACGLADHCRVGGLLDAVSRVGGVLSRDRAVAAREWEKFNPHGSQSCLAD